MESRQEFMKTIGKLEKEKSQYLQKLFAHCPDYVIEHMRYMKIAGNQTLIHAGTACEQVYVLLKGEMRGLDFQKVGNVYSFTGFSETEVIGDYEVFGDFKEYRVSVRAITECELLAIPASVYLRWMKGDIEAIFMRTQSLMYTLTEKNSEERKFHFMSCRDRLILYLVEVYERVPDRTFCKVKKTQPELARRTGFTVRTVQRAIQSLKNDGLITTESGKICMNQVQYERLKEYTKEHMIE